MEKVTDAYLYAVTQEGNTPGMRKMARELELSRKVVEVAREYEKECANAFVSLIDQSDWKARANGIWGDFSRALSALDKMLD